MLICGWYFYQQQNYFRLSYLNVLIVEGLQITFSGPLRCVSAVMDLIYWKDTERTGMVFTGLVVGLLFLFQLSIITVVSTLSLAIMCFTISIRIYCKVLHALQLRDSAHPFK